MDCVMIRLLMNPNRSKKYLIRKAKDEKHVNRQGRPRYAPFTDSGDRGAHCELWTSDQELVKTEMFSPFGKSAKAGVPSKSAGGGAGALEYS